MRYAIQVLDAGTWVTLFEFEPKQLRTASGSMGPLEVADFVVTTTRNALAPTIEPANVRAVHLPGYKGPRWQA